MNTIFRMLLIACLILPFAACKKETAPTAAPAATAVPLPTSDEQKDWMPYLNYVLAPQMDGVNTSPYAYFLPNENSEGFGGKYERQLEKLEGDLSRGIVEGNMLVFASPSSGKLAEMATVAFGQVQPGTMKGVKVVFIGQSADADKVKAAAEPAGVKFVFIEAK